MKSLLRHVVAVALIIGGGLAGCQVASVPPHQAGSDSGDKSQKAASYKILALLALSGDRSFYGHESLKGIQLALESVKGRPGHPFIELVILDTAVSGFGLKEKLPALFAKLDPLAVVGPMFSREVQLIAGLSQSTAVPFITPTAMLSDVRQLSPYVFSTAFTVDLQAERLVDYAMQTGYRRFCVLGPQDGLGRELSRAFAGEVKRRGGEIIDEEIYVDTETDFRNQIQHLKAVDLRRHGKVSTKKTTKGVPGRSVYVPGFDAMFLPGEYRQSVLIASQLRFHGIKVPLLGSNAWHSADLGRLPDVSLEGGIFTDSFFAESADSRVHEFLEQYRTQYHSDPSPFVAQSYEATQLVLQAVHQGARSGSAVRELLSSGTDLPAFMGSKGFRASGVLNRNGFVVQIASNGKLSQVQAGTVQGQVITIKGKTYVIRDASGKTVRFRVDEHSKIKGIAKVGDRVEAKIIDGRTAYSLTMK